MSGLLDMLTQHVDQSTVNQIGNQIGTDPSTTQRAIAAALPTLFGAMAQHAQTPTGETQIHEAVTNAPADGATPTPQAASGGLLSRVLGPHQQQAEQTVAQSSGINTQQAGKVLMYLAPIAIAVLARHHAQQPQATQQQGGLAGLLRGAAESMGSGSGVSSGAVGQVLGRLFG
jgi:hypothetical protein